jgi:peptidoglycan/LPS O-acetylase OafA/YrhL
LARRIPGKLSKNMKRFPELDAIRGLAVLLVLIHNTDIYPQLHLGWIVDNGWMGVDLFFVLSGFLITGILLDTKQSKRYFLNFYMRRCFRIWPLYYSTLIFLFIIIPLLFPSQAHSIFDSRSSPWWAYPLFLQNYLVPVPTAATGPLGVTWSLGVEEQFYLVWPIVVRHCNEDQLRKIAIVAMCVSPILRLFLSHAGVQIYSNPICRLDGLMAGAFLALLVRSDRFAPSRFVGLAWGMLALSLTAALLLDKAQARWAVFSFVAVASLSLVFLALFSKQVYLQMILRSRILIFTGTISYGIYMLEKLPADLVKARLGSGSAPWMFPITAAATFLLATISWYCLESPFLRLNRFFRDSSGRRVRLSSGALTTE